MSSLCEDLGFFVMPYVLSESKESSAYTSLEFFVTNIVPEAAHIGFNKALWHAPAFLVLNYSEKKKKKETFNLRSMH